MTNKDRIQRIIGNVNQMRENSQDMRMWKNIPLAKECVQLLKDIDDPEETPMGKALACEAVIQQLPEYDVPRFVLSILRYKLELVSTTPSAILQPRRCRKRFSAWRTTSTSTTSATPPSASAMSAT